MIQIDHSVDVEHPHKQPKAAHQVRARMIDPA